MTKTLPLRFAPLALLALVGACASPPDATVAASTPPLVLEEFFPGRTVGQGVFTNSWTGSERRFDVVIDSTWDGRTLTLVEDFVYADGEKSKRVWRLTRVGERRWEGRAADVIGTAQGEEAGNAFQFGYRMNLKVGDSTWAVRFDDWMFRIDEDVVLNTAQIYRWGIWIGTVQLSFRRLP